MDIDREEFQALIFMSGKMLTSSETKELFDSINKSHSGGIDLDEFILWYRAGGLAQQLAKGLEQRLAKDVVPARRPENSAAPKSTE
jgi:hypothetical protein